MRGSIGVQLNTPRCKKPPRHTKLHKATGSAPVHVHTADRKRPARPEDTQVKAERGSVEKRFAPAGLLHVRKAI